MQPGGPGTPAPSTRLQSGATRTACHFCGPVRRRALPHPSHPSAPKRVGPVERRDSGGPRTGRSWKTGAWSVARRWHAVPCQVCRCRDSAIGPSPCRWDCRAMDASGFGGSEVVDHWQPEAAPGGGAGRPRHPAIGLPRSGAPLDTMRKSPRNQDVGSSPPAQPRSISAGMPAAIGRRVWIGPHGVRTGWTGRRRLPINRRSQRGGRTGRSAPSRSPR